MNVAERWAWVEPGVVLDELNAQLKPHGLRFAPDISTASRATVGGMIANNSSGARSVLYGKTIDHVLELHVVLVGRIGRAFPAARRARDWTTACAGDDARGRVLPHGPASSRRRSRDEIERRFPKVLRRVGGYNLDEFVDPRRPFNLSKIIVGSEGHARPGRRGEGQPGAAARRQGGARRSSSRSCSTRSRRRRSMLRHGPSAVEVMDRFILDHAQREPARSTRCGAASCIGDPGALLCVEFYGDRADDLPPRLDGARARPRRVRLPLPVRGARSRRPIRRASGASAKRRWGCRWR